MQLPFLRKQEKKKNFFLSLLIKPHKVGAILFEEINSKLFILSTNEIEVGDTTQLSGEELLSAADQVVSFVEGKLPEATEVERTIFSVPYYWVEEGKIRQEYLDRLKKVCKDLGLVPIGYIISIEAIVAFLQKSDGAPVSAIFIEITKDELLLYVVRGSRVVEEKRSRVDGSIAKTAEKLLAEVQSVDVLPSKIILFDSEGISDVQQEFLSHKWSKDIPFLHLPQTMVLERGFENEAIINGVATEMELEVLHDIGSDRASATTKGEESARRERDSGERDISEDKLEQMDAEDFGFAKEETASLVDRRQDSKGEKDQETEDKGRQQNGKEIEAIEEPEGKGSEEEPNISYFKEDSEEALLEGEKDDQAPPKFMMPSFSMILSLTSRLKIPNLKSIAVSQNILRPLKIKLILGILGVVLSAIVVSFVYYNFILRAEIKIMADRKSIEKNQNITFSSNLTSGMNINMEIIEVTISGEESKNATGKKETGDKAKGEVTLYNKTDQKRTFAKGTIIVGPNDLEFELTDEVSIASTSPFSTTLSSSKGKVTASSFGREYNLPSNTNFTVKGFSSAQFIGKNSDSITGGTKKETVVVSSEDLDDLLLEVTEKLEKEAISNAREKLSQDQEILPRALSSDVLERKYTKKEGEEAGSVGVSAKIKYAIGKYKKSDIEKIIESLSKPDIPGTYTLRSSDSKFEITNLKIGKEQTAQGTLKVNAIYTPQIESEKLALSLKGKTQDEAERQIKTVAGVTEVFVTFRNNLPFMPLILPQNARNILIEEEY